MLAGVVGVDSAICGFKYDNKGNLIEGNAAYGTKIECSYQKNNLTSVLEIFILISCHWDIVKR